MSLDHYYLKLFLFEKLNVECRNHEENTDEEEDDDKINKVKFQERLKRQKIQVSLSDHL